MLNAHGLGRRTYEASPGVAGSQTGLPPRRGGCRERFNHRAQTSTGETFSLFAALAWRLLARGFPLWRFGYDQVVGLANEGFEFAGGQDVRVFEKDPFVAADIRGLGDAFDFEQFVELFRSALQGDWCEVALGEVHHSEYLAAHFEAQGFAPLKLLGRVGKREAEFAEPVGVGHGENDSAA